MPSIEALKRMILNFSPSELRELMDLTGYFGHVNDFRRHALEVLPLRSRSVQSKILEIDRRRFRTRNIHFHRQRRPYRSISVPWASRFVNNSYGVFQRDVIQDDYTDNDLTESYWPPALINTESTIGSPDHPAQSEVKFSDLPMFDVQAVLLKPSSLIPCSNSVFQENHFQFYFSSQQVQEIESSRNLCSSARRHEYELHVRLRFCLLETNSVQDDCFPQKISVKVNGLQLELPGDELSQKSCSKPAVACKAVDITKCCRLSNSAQNNLVVSWVPDTKTFAVAVFLVRRLDVSVLLGRLRSRGVRDPDLTRALVREKLGNAASGRSRMSKSLPSDVSGMGMRASARASLMCPIGKMKIQIPCRTVSCTHLQCFDAVMFLKTNEENSVWVCPVCDKPALFSSLVIDGLFTEILSKAPSCCTKVQLRYDGSWAPIMQQAEFASEFGKSHFGGECRSKPKSGRAAEVVDLTEDTTDEYCSKTKKQCLPEVDITSVASDWDALQDAAKREKENLDFSKKQIVEADSTQSKKRDDVKIVDLTMARDTSKNIETDCTLTAGICFDVQSGVTRTSEINGENIPCVDTHKEAEEGKLRFGTIHITGAGCVPNIVNDVESEKRLLDSEDKTVSKPEVIDLTECDDMDDAQQNTDIEPEDNPSRKETTNIKNQSIVSRIACVNSGGKIGRRQPLD